jgi:hypothetical protein
LDSDEARYLVDLVCLVCFVDLVDLVHLVSFVQPNKAIKRDRPNRPEQPAGSHGLSPRTVMNNPGWWDSPVECLSAFARLKRDPIMFFYFGVYSPSPNTP